MQANDGFEVVDGTLVSYTGTQESIELPPGIHTIDARACAGNVRVRELSLGPEVEAVKSEAFAGCTSLERVRVDSLYSLGHGAFRGCTSLTEVLIPDDLRELGSAVFSGCTSLTYVDLDGANFSQVQRMDGMFAECTSLEELDLSDIDATSLLSARDMFGGCTSLIFWEMSEAWPVGLEGAVPAPPANSRGSWWSKRQQEWLTAQQIASRGPLADTLTSYNQRELTALAGAEVEDGVLLYYDGSRRTVVVPEGVTAIGDYAFRGRRNVESVLLPHTLRRIGMEAFAGCTALRNVEFASGPDDEDCALEIKTRAFAGCTALTSIELPATMSSRSGDYLFEGCTSLVSATLPAVGVFGAFEGCARLHEVTVGGVTFYAHDWDEDYLSYVVMAARTDALDIREGVIYDFASSTKSSIYDWEADQERHGERPYGCAVLPEGYRCTRYLGRCSRIGIIPKDVHVHAIAPKAFPGIRHLVAFVCPEGMKKIGWGAFPAMKGREFLTRDRIQRDVSPDGW